MLIGNPRRWRFEHQVEVLIALLIGAAIGIGFGYFQFTSPIKSSFGLWIGQHSQDAMTWAVGGAIAVGVPAYFRRLIKLSK